MNNKINFVIILIMLIPVSVKDKKISSFTVLSNTVEINPIAKLIRHSLNKKTIANKNYIEKIKEIPRTHPLHIYLTHKYNIANIDRINANKYNKIKDIYSNSFTGEELINSYIKRAAKNKKWDEILNADITLKDIKDKKIKCLYLKAKINSLYDIAERQHEKEIINNYHCKYSINFKKSYDEKLFELATNATGKNKARYIRSLANKAKKEKYKKYIQDYLDIYINPQILLDQLEKFKKLSKDSKYSIIIIKGIIAASKDLRFAEKSVVI